MNISKYEDAIQNCRFCFMCRHLSAIGNVRFTEADTPRVRAAMLYGLRTGTNSFDDEDFVDVLYRQDLGRDRRPVGEGERNELREGRAAKVHAFALLRRKSVVALVGKCLLRDVRIANRLAPGECRRESQECQKCSMGHTRIIAKTDPACHPAFCAMGVGESTFSTSSGEIDTSTAVPRISTFMQIVAFAPLRLMYPSVPRMGPNFTRT